MKIYFAPLALSALIITGCATSAPTNGELRAAPQSQIYYPSEATTSETARAIFVRDVGALGSANFLHLYIDGKKAASLNTAEKVEFSLAKGEHVFGVKPTDPFGLASTFSIDQDLKPGRTYRYRLSHTPNGSRISRDIESAQEDQPKN